RYEGVAQTQIQREPRGDTPVILKERRGRGPVQLAKRCADELKCSGRFSGEEVFQWRGICYLRNLSATELDSATRVVDVVIGVDVRELAAELQAVLASQIREIVLEVKNRVAKPGRTAAPTAQNLPGKTGNLGTRKPTRGRDAGVEGIVFAIGEKVVVVGSQ